MAKNRRDSNHEGTIWVLSFSYKPPSRSTPRLNTFDPESLLSGEEIARGCSYTNSRRRWSNLEQYEKACSGEFTGEHILRIAPRVICPAAETGQTQRVYCGQVEELETLVEASRVEVGHE
jgi:hypothetical protein